MQVRYLAEIVSWYYPETDTLTIYSQDSDTYEFQKKAEENLRKVFEHKIPVPVSYKSNDAILCQLIRNGEIDIHNLGEYRNDTRKITYSKERKDHSIVLVTELIDNDLFEKLIEDENVHIIF